MPRAAMNKDVDGCIRRLVLKMRTAQNDYFKNRTQSNLIAAKRIEDEVDKALKIYPFLPEKDEPGEQKEWTDE